MKKLKMLSFTALIAFVSVLFFCVPSQSSFAAGTPGAYGAPGRLKLSTTPVTVSSWTQIISAIPQAIKSLVVYSSANYPLQIGVGVSGSEAPQIVIPASLTTETLFPIAIPAGARISVIALDSTASTGEVQINAVYN